MNELTKDKIAEKLTQVMRNTRGRSSRFRSSNRNNQFSKFMLTNTYQSTGLSKDASISNANNSGDSRNDNVHPCFRDDLFNEIFIHKISEKYFDVLYDMVVDEEYDTDAVEIDINNNNMKQSNIINFIKKVADQNVNINESDLSGLLSVGNACI
eukprot:401767_1